MWERKTQILLTHIKHKTEVLLVGSSLTNVLFARLLAYFAWFECIFSEVINFLLYCLLKSILYFLYLKIYLYIFMNKFIWHSMLRPNKYFLQIYLSVFCHCEMLLFSLVLVVCILNVLHKQLVGLIAIDIFIVSAMFVCVCACIVFVCSLFY
jgi:hypothetical protein